MAAVVRAFLGGLVAVAVYSAIESFLLSALARGSDSGFWDLMVRPGGGILWHRFLIFLFAVTLGIYVRRSRRKRRVAERALVEARESFHDELERTEGQLRLASAVFEHTLDGIVVTDTDGTIQTVNPAFTEITGYAAEDAVGQNPRILKSDRHEPDFYRGMWNALISEGKWSGEIWNRHKSGRAYPEWMTISAIKDRNGKTTSYVSVFHDMSDVIQREEKMRHLAHHDPLTGLPNRLLFEDRLNQAVAQARRSGSSVAVIYADIDNFKAINDRFGHAAGDLLLQELGTRLESCVREDDTVARLGGDEFVIVLPRLASTALAKRAIDCIRDTVAKPFILGDHEVEATLSIGAASYPGDGVEPATLVRNADLAMYQAKEQGKNAARPFSPEIARRVQARSQMMAELREALEGGQLAVYFQPRIDVATSCITGAEALLRWTRPDSDPLAAGEFLDLADESGLIVAIGERVMRSVCEQMKSWRDQGLGEIPVAVNISTRELHDPSRAEWIRQLLEGTATTPSHFDLEVTEHSLTDLVGSAPLTLSKLSSLGVGIVVERFGANASSLTSLQKAPVRAVKIDGSVIERLPDDPAAAGIANAIISASKDLCLEVMAAGVSTPEQAAFLHDRGCHEMQGHLFSAPVPADEFRELLAAGKIEVPAA